MTNSSAEALQCAETTLAIWYDSVNVNGQVQENNSSDHACLHCARTIACIFMSSARNVKALQDETYTVLRREGRGIHLSTLQLGNFLFNMG